MAVSDVTVSQERHLAAIIRVYSLNDSRCRLDIK